MAEVATKGRARNYRLSSVAHERFIVIITTNASVNRKGRPQLWIRDRTCAPRGFFPSPFNPQYNSRISRNSWVSRPRLYFERKRSITTFLDTKDWYRPIKPREKEIFANKIILYTKRIKRVKISIANRKASYARVIMIYVVDIGFSLRGIRSSIMFAKNRWPLSRWPERLSNTLFHFRSRSYLPLKSKDRLRLICGSRPRDLGLRLFYKKAGKSSWSMRGTRVLTLNFSPLPR